MFVIQNADRSAKTGWLRQRGTTEKYSGQAGSMAESAYQQMHAAQDGSKEERAPQVQV
jgi:hypothetical protein